MPSLLMRYPSHCASRIPLRNPSWRRWRWWWLLGAGAVLQSCGVAELRSCGVAELRSSGICQAFFSRRQISATAMWAAATTWVLVYSGFGASDYAYLATSSVRNRKRWGMSDNSWHVEKVEKVEKVEISWAFETAGMWGMKMVASSRMALGRKW